MTANEEEFYSAEVRSAAISCVYNLVKLANALQCLGMNEDCKQVLETTCDIYGHAHNAFVRS